MVEKSPAPLFETKPAKNLSIFRLYAVSVFASIIFIFYYRVHHLPEPNTAAKWAWLGAFFSELWFTFYWLVTVVVRWNPVHRRTFKDRLSERCEKVLPGVDIFVCTADPVIEPPTMVINTVLSVMAYNYPPEKMSVYLSDDGCSDLTFYALLEASQFAKKWLPFCRKFNVEPRSPEAYFKSAAESLDDYLKRQEWLSVKNLYKDMKRRIEAMAELGRVPDDVRKQHKGFTEWDFISSRRDHQTILQILFDGTDPTAVDDEGQPLPTLVYLAREKRPQYHHNFKAGALNALIRVSSKISNSPIILNVDCDMYSNNSDSVRDALCFFLDEENGHDIAYIQYPQNFDNLTTNDLYSSSLGLINHVEFHGLDGNGGPMYIGTGCFHRREALSGGKYTPEGKTDSSNRDCHDQIQIRESARVLEETCKTLADCAYEDNTDWGKKMGLKYGCAVEDVLTGLSIQCQGWRSVYFKPDRKGFLGVAPTTLLQSLVQHKRWSGGDFQITLSRHCPFVYGRGKIPLKLQLCYCNYLLWAANSLPSLYYATILPLCLLRGISLFPKVSSPWGLPFMYVVAATMAYSAGEFMWTCGSTLRGWWSDQRMGLYRRTTSHLFGFLDNILGLLGVTNSAFVITEKVAGDDVSHRYEQELMEFGAPSPMFTILTTIALINASCLIGTTLRLVMHRQALDQLAMQIGWCGSLVCINLPLYDGLFFREDEGRMPAAVTYKSATFALLAIALAWV
ncbi:2OG-FeII_Oxy_2 domain-containing protein [Psidium guajava]|nr:2OG-FeII_Oxy_2 domain-containing protein [Psidium guajava]